MTYSAYALRALVFSSVVLVAACDGDAGVDDAGPEVDAGSDAGADLLDAGRDDAGSDAGAAPDGGTLGDDGGTSDGGSSADAASGSDAAMTDGATAPDGGGNTLGDRECRSEADCGSLAFRCLAPGEFFGCGICREPETTCASDAECRTGGEVCEGEPSDCFCSGGNTCRPGCTDSSCDVGEQCGTSGHCEPARCGGGARTCPAEFDCVSRECVRRSCRGDADCAGGWCVEGACYTMPGSCSPPPA